MNERLEPGADSLWPRRANRTTGTFRAQGGRLYLTDQRLIFRPHALERLLRARDWSVPLTAITDVGVEGVSGGPFSGGLRKRLRVSTGSDGVNLFVVNDVHQVADALAMAVAQRRNGGADLPG